MFYKVGVVWGFILIQIGITSASEDITQCAPLGRSLLVATSIGKILKVSSEDSEIFSQWSGVHTQEITSLYFDEKYKVIHTVSLDDSIKALSLKNLK